MGDINGDGIVNSGDVITALQLVMGQAPETIMQEATNTNVDGTIGLAEAIIIIRKLGSL